MPFYYPNWNNDFWRVMGLLFFKDKDHFTVPGQKRFDQALVETFCREQGLALYDTAYEVKRLKDNASDKFLEVVKPTDTAGTDGTHSQMPDTGDNRPESDRRYRRDLRLR